MRHLILMHRSHKLAPFRTRYMHLEHIVHFALQQVSPAWIEIWLISTHHSLATVHPSYLLHFHRLLHQLLQRVMLLSWRNYAHNWFVVAAFVSMVLMECPISPFVH